MGIRRRRSKQNIKKITINRFHRPSVTKIDDSEDERSLDLIPGVDLETGQTIDPEIHPSNSASQDKKQQSKKRRERKRRRRSSNTKIEDSDDESSYVDVLTGVDLGRPTVHPVLDIMPKRVGPNVTLEKGSNHREKSTDKSELPVFVSATKENSKSNISMVETTTRIKTVDKAALTIQRNWRRRLAVRRRAVNRIIAVIRGKQ